MKVVYKKKVLDEIKDFLFNLYKQQGDSGLETINYIKVTQQEMDEISNGSGFTKVNEIEKCFMLSQGYSWIVHVVKIKVEE